MRKKSRDIGVFDSGLGGLFVLKTIVERMPEYSYVYLGDTKHLPYGDRTQAEIFRFLKKGVDFLLRKNCGLVIVACNTASAVALRKIQREYLPVHYPDRKVLGVLVPAVEEAVGDSRGRRIGVLATKSTVASRAFAREIAKADPTAFVFQKAAPLLVPMIERGETDRVKPVLKKYLKPLVKKRIDVLVLGCTHYPIIKTAIRDLVGAALPVVSQDECVPAKLESYLARHSEITLHKTARGHRTFYMTKLAKNFETTAHRWFRRTIKFHLAKL